MASGKVEYLDQYLGEGRAQVGRGVNPRGALKHLAAAHAKLEKLQLWRRDMKQDYADRIAERDAALLELEGTYARLDEASAAITDTQARYDDMAAELERAHELLHAQKALIDQLHEELAEQEDAARPERPREFNDDAPSLTARALERIQRKS